MAVKKEKIHFASVEELLGAPAQTGEGTVELKISEIYPFENYPFKVVDDDKMDDLVQSIKDNGVLTPVIVRPDDAVIAMVDSNVQREEILPSERAWSLKMKLDAMKRQGRRSDLTSAQNERRLETADIVGEEMGISSAQVRRYIRLTELVPELLEIVDKKRLTMAIAVDISYFDKRLQEWIYEYFVENGFLKNEQITALKNSENIVNMAQEAFLQLMEDAVKPKKKSKAVSLSERKLDKYFPYKTSAAEREKVIIELLEKWKKEQEGA